MAKRATTAQADAIEMAGVRLTHPDRVLYPEQGLTKQDLATYYVAVADRMLPHVVDRPLTLVRCPRGRRKTCFYQRHASAGLPAAVQRVTVPGFEERGAFLMLRDIEGLISLVQQAVLEIHPWNARVDRADRPDRVIFDLDPGEGVSFFSVVTAALDVRDRLDALGLRSFVKTTGGKGLHVVLPFQRRHDWAETKHFAATLAALMAEDTPDAYTTGAAKAARRGRIFIDYLRNDPAASAIAPYSPRVRPGAPVATPLAWSELTSDLDPKRFTVTTVPDRLASQSADPWQGFDAVQQSITADIRRRMGLRE